jgi:DUF1680 family protein
MHRTLLVTTLLGLFVAGFASHVCDTVTAADELRGPSPRETRILPDPGSVQLGGDLGRAYDRGIARLNLPPYESAVFLRADISFEMERVFTNYSGDISGRFIQIASLTSPRGQMSPATLAALLEGISRYQKADGHFGADVDWNAPLEPENPRAVLLPIFWGNSRLLVGLLAAHDAFGRPDTLAAARRLGDFYIATADRFLDPAREPEYRSTGSYAAGYPTDYFPGIEGLALLHQVTGDPRYLAQAERMAEFFRRFDQLPIDHSHGNLVTHYGLLLLYEITGKQEYLDRTLAQWTKAVLGGYVWPLGGVGEKFHVSYASDEGCSEADWLRLNLKLWHITGEVRFLETAERLLWNHYAMNRTANGGYGHHNFVCDPTGPLLMQPQFTEAVWCCTFHGLLGLHALKSHIVTGSADEVSVNFPLDCRTPIDTVQGDVLVGVACREETNSLTCRVTSEGMGSGELRHAVKFRRPAWATSVTVTDSAGQQVEIPDTTADWLTLPGALVAAGADVQLGWKVTVEDRRLKPIKLNPNAIGRHEGVVLRSGPHVLMTNSDSPRPVLVVRVDEQGNCEWPSAAESGFVALQVSDVNLDGGALQEAVRHAKICEIKTWGQVRQDAPVAFVFDLITIPDKSLSELAPHAQ